MIKDVFSSVTGVLLQIKPLFSFPLKLLPIKLISDSFMGFKTINLSFVTIIRMFFKKDSTGSRLIISIGVLIDIILLSRKFSLR